MEKDIGNEGTLRFELELELVEGSRGLGYQRSGRWTGTERMRDLIGMILGMPPACYLDRPLARCCFSDEDALSFNFAEYAPAASPEPSLGRHPQLLPTTMFFLLKVDQSCVLVVTRIMFTLLLLLPK
jgi:hypothetical protein